MKTISSQDRTTRGRMATARELRLTPTPAEAALWEQIRNRRLGSLKFRRQHPWHGYVLDVFCPALQLAIEVDGGVHRNPEQAQLDAERRAHLESAGIRVLRFRNDQVEQDMDGVLKRILQEGAGLTTSASLPSPLPTELESERVGYGVRKSKDRGGFASLD
jgi:very-short-patch-repair endonuclease